MERFILTALIGITCVAGYAQKRATFSAGVEGAKPLYFLRGNASGATGVGLQVGWEHPLGKRWAWTVEAGFIHFSGDYHYLNFSNGLHDTIQRNFSLLPVMTGFRFYPVGGLFLELQGGAGVGLSRQTGTEFLAAGSIGYCWPLRTHGIEVSVQELNMIPGFGIPEANSLQNGGYGYGSVRVMYCF